jgi:hypothetical protein
MDVRKLMGYESPSLTFPRLRSTHDSRQPPRHRLLATARLSDEQSCRAENLIKTQGGFAKIKE